VISLRTPVARLRVDASAVVVRPASLPGEIDVVPRLAPPGPAPARLESFPTTICWKYSIEVAKPG
jgi:hypothetical protein